MNEKNQQESFRRWGYGLAAAASVVAAVTCFAGGRRTEKSGVRLISGLLWLAGAAGWSCACCGRSAAASRQSNRERRI